MWPRLARLAHSIVLSVAIAIAIDVGRTAVGVVGAVAWSGRDVGNGHITVLGWISVSGVLIPAYAAFLGWWTTRLFVGGFEWWIVWRWRGDEWSAIRFDTTGRGSPRKGFGRQVTSC